MTIGERIGRKRERDENKRRNSKRKERNRRKGKERGMKNGGSRKRRLGRNQPASFMDKRREPG